ncbi:MAG: hypothetical protein ACE5FV_13875 [Woeseia sp.]
MIEPQGRRPNKTLNIEKQIFPNTYTGPITDTETLTIHNKSGNTITITQPQVVGRSTGAPIPEMTVSTPANLTIANGGTMTFDVTYSDNIDGTGGRFAQGKMEITWSDGTTTCPFGPIWVDGSFWINPP